jgi:hypothetical protein
MSLEKQWRMLQALARKTEAGQVNWQPSADDHAFQVSFNAYTLILKETSRSSDDECDYEIILLDENGQVADRFFDMALHEEFSSTIPEQKDWPYPMLRRLFASARRKATGLDKILDTILDDLDDIPF